MIKLDIIRRAALNYLARRDYSQYEIIQKLKLKGYPHHDIETVLADLIQKELINDQRFTEHYIHWRRQKGIGPERISLELQARGITHEMIADQLQITDNAWFIEARNVWQKQFKNKVPNDFKTRAKQMRFLQYRGFTPEQIKRVFLDIKDVNTKD